jgi:hypothetical protein
MERTKTALAVVFWIDIIFIGALFVNAILTFTLAGASIFSAPDTYEYVHLIATMWCARSLRHFEPQLWEWNVFAPLITFAFDVVNVLIVSLVIPGTMDMGMWIFTLVVDALLALSSVVMLIIVLVFYWTAPSPTLLPKHVRLTPHHVKRGSHQQTPVLLLDSN